MRHSGTGRIETERLILRRFTLEDAEAMYRNWAGDPAVTKYLMWQTHENVEQTKEVLRSWIAAYENDDKYEWCIAKKENNEPVGSIGAFHYQEKINAIEVGYCISRAYWHQGITSEALGAVMQYLLDEVGVDRIEARHDAQNIHSGGVMRKCGMKHEGTKIRAGWTNAGICDMELYGYVRGVTDADGQKEPHSISDAEIERLAILAQLALSGEEKEQAKRDVGEMLGYVDKLGELDTEGVEPMTQLLGASNIFREDVVTNGDGSADALLNAPCRKNGAFLVPKTIS